MIGNQVYPDFVVLDGLLMPQYKAKSECMLACTDNT